MTHVNHTIKGVPFGKFKTRGDRGAPRRWTEAIKKQSNALGHIKNACILKVTFLLPPDKYPGDLPYGSDLDNLLKPFLDALNETVFSEAEGRDSCILSMTVMKAEVSSTQDAGVHFEIVPVIVPRQGG